MGSTAAELRAILYTTMGIWVAGGIIRPGTTEWIVSREFASFRFVKSLIIELILTRETAQPNSTLALRRVATRLQRTFQWFLRSPLRF